MCSHRAQSLCTDRRKIFVIRKASQACKMTSKSGGVNLGQHTWPLPAMKLKTGFPIQLACLHSVLFVSYFNDWLLVIKLLFLWHRGQFPPCDLSLCNLALFMCFSLYVHDKSMKCGWIDNFIHVYSNIFIFDWNCIEIVQINTGSKNQALKI